MWHNCVFQVVKVSNNRVVSLTWIRDDAVIIECRGGIPNQEWVGIHATDEGSHLTTSCIGCIDTSEGIIPFQTITSLSTIARTANERIVSSLTNPEVIPYSQGGVSRESTSKLKGSNIYQSVATRCSQLIGGQTSD